MAIEKNLLDFVQTTKTDASDWIHISQGGVDKRISLANFLAAVNGNNPFNISVKEELSDNRVLTKSDINSYIRCLNATQTTIQVGTEAANGWRVGDSIILRKEGLGNVILQEGGGVTIRVSSSGVALTEIGQAGQLIYVGSNTWDFLTGGNARATVQGSVSFLTVAGLVAGVTNEGVVVDFEELANSNAKVSTIWNNTTSKEGGADYTIWEMSAYRTFISNPSWVPDGAGSPSYRGGDHYVGGTDYVAILNVSGKINCHNFGSIKHNTDCVPTINAAMQYAKSKVRDGQPAKVFVPYVGTVQVSSVSLLFPRNIIVDLGWNRYKLSDNASKYVFSQDDLVTDDFLTSNGGNIELYNFHLDGNARGGQTRAIAGGTDVRDMYCGFGMLFFGLRSLKVHDFKVTDTEAWGCAYFKCRDTEWWNGTFDQDETRIGYNGDGITGQASRTHIWNITGYTNDDLTAMVTTRASIGGIQIWNDGIDIECFNVHDIEMTDKAGKSCHFASGVYPSDGNVIKQWTMANISGNCENGLWRCGNYFNSLGASNGLVENITEININGYSRTTSQGQRLIFRSNVYQINISEFRNIVNANTGANQFLRIVTDSVVNNLFVSSGVYQQQYTGGSREGVIFVDSSSALKQLTATDVFHSLTGAQISTPEKFTFIRNFGTRPKLNMQGLTKGNADGANLNQLKADFFVSDTGILAGNLNVKWKEGFSTSSANYTGTTTIEAVYNCGIVYLRGSAITNAVSITTPTQIAAFTRPAWAKPRDAQMFFPGVFSKNGGGVGGTEGCQILVRYSTQDIDLFHISGNPLDSYISLSHIAYECDPSIP